LFHFSMDIFSLPSVFLHEMMKHVTVKDRLRLRRTCRAFEKLVAESNAGYTEDAGIALDKMMFDLDISDVSVSGLDIVCNEEVFHRILSLRKRLFNRISFGDFFIKTDGSTSALEFIQQFTQNFKTRQLSFYINNAKEIDNALKLMDEFPRSKYCMAIWYAVLPEKLVELPPTKKLGIYKSSENLVQTHIPIGLFYKMISLHKYLSFDYGYVILTFNEWNNALEMISDHKDDINVQFKMESETLVSYLRTHGISENSEEGDLTGEYEVLGNYPQDIHCQRDASIYLRFKNCRISITNIVWTRDFSGTNVEIITRK
ncbi:hypothetical protein PENTCL1PPCAC_13303, partial [Pristionchus entomophagus]